MDYRPPGFFVHGISQARTLEWVAISFSRGSSWPRYQTWVSCIAGRFFTTEPLEKPTTDGSVQFSSVAQSRSTLHNPMDHSTPGLLVHHQLPEYTQTHVHWVSDAIQPSHPVIPFSSCLQSFPASGSFQMSQLFPSGGQSTGVSASRSVLPMNTHDWSPLEWTGWISLQSKGLSRIFSNATVQKHQFFGAQPSL